MSCIISLRVVRARWDCSWGFLELPQKLLEPSQFRSNSLQLSQILSILPPLAPLAAPHNPLQRPSFFGAGTLRSDRDTNTSTPMDFFSAPREHPLFARATLRPLAGAASRCFKGRSNNPRWRFREKNSTFNLWGWQAACLIAISNSLPPWSVFFSLPLRLLSLPSPFVRSFVSRLSLAVFEASRWFIRAARSLIFRDGFFFAAIRRGATSPRSGIIMTLIRATHPIH